MTKESLEFSLFSKEKFSFFFLFNRDNTLLQTKKNTDGWWWWCCRRCVYRRSESFFHFIHTFCMSNFVKATWNAWPSHRESVYLPFSFSKWLNEEETAMPFRQCGLHAKHVNRSSSMRNTKINDTYLMEQMGFLSFTLYVYGVH